jgi:hypothetical protein
MKRIITTGILLLIFACPAWAKVTISIVDHPDWVLRYSPVFITAKIVNEGTDPVLIPADDYSLNRYFVETGKSGGTLEERRQFDASVSKDEVLWLRPGESWLFRTDVQPWMTLPGEYQARTGLRGNGECILRPTGAEAFPVLPIEHETGVQRYQCWKGEILSNTVTIAVLEPTSAADIESREYLQSMDVPSKIDCKSEGELPTCLRFAYKRLREKHPASHYTYVGGFYRAGRSAQALQDLLTMQPDHPLTPYTRLQWALAVVRGECRSARANIAVSDLELPSGLSEYLAQEKRIAEAGRSRSTDSR